MIAARKTLRDGFTLVEVLVTMALLAIVLPVAMRGISLAAHLGGEARRWSEASELARLKLDDLVSSGDWNSGKLGGDFGSDWPDYRWTAVAGPWGGSSAVQEVDVTVTWSEGRGEQSMVMSTLVSTGATTMQGPQ